MQYIFYVRTTRTIKHVSLESIFEPNEIARPKRSPISNSRKIVVTAKVTLKDSFLYLLYYIPDKISFKRNSNKRDK